MVDVYLAAAALAVVLALSAWGIFLDRRGHG